MGQRNILLGHYFHEILRVQLVHLLEGMTQGFVKGLFIIRPLTDDLSTR